MKKTILVTVLFVLSLTSKAEIAGKEGEEWLRWTPSQREIYVRGWTIGIVDGFLRGCASGAVAGGARSNQEVQRFSDDCNKREPMKVVDSYSERSITVTNFYRRYPDSRFLLIAEVLRDLAAGLSIAQIHDQHIKRVK